MATLVREGGRPVPDAANTDVGSNRDDALAQEITAALGHLPPILKIAYETGGLEQLWAQARYAHLTSPVPVTTRARILAYLGRWASSPYNLVANACRLHASGVASADILALISNRGPGGDPTEDHDLVPLAAGLVSGWPEPGSAGETAIIRAAAWCYLRRPGDDVCQRWLRQALSGADHARLIALLAWANTCRAWTDAHPEVDFHDDPVTSEQLLALVADEPEIKRYFDTYVAVVAVEDAEITGERLTALVEHASDMIIVMEDDGALRYASPAAERILGHRVVDFIGTNAIDLVHPDDLPIVLESLQVTLDEGGIRSPLPFRVRRADGEYISVEAVTNNRMHDPQVRGLVITIRDVSERLQVEGRLAAAEERFRVGFEGAPIGMALVAPDGRWLRVNDALCRIVGYTPEELMSGMFQDITHSDDLEADLELVQECLDGVRQTYVMEKRYVHRSGHTVWIQLSVALIRDPEGEPLYFISQIQDVTARLRDEAALRQAEAQFRMAFDHAPIGMALIGPAGQFFQVNDALCAMLGFTVGELLARSLPELLPDGDREDAEVALDRLASGDERTYRAEVHFVGALSRSVWGHLSIAPVGDASQDEGRTPSSFIIQIEDITDRKEAEDALLHQTLHDSLTGLPNRLLLRDRLRQALVRGERTSSSVAVLFIDLDRFKIINDSLGHDAGDQVLVEIGRRLAGIARAGDTVARIGGDEFVVLADLLASAEDEPVAIAERIRHVVSLPLHVAGSDIVPSASIGIAVASDGQNTPEQLLRAADTAMYQAKDRGRDRHELYDSSLQQRAQLRMEIEGVLRAAIDEDRLRVLYQPIVDVVSGKVVSVEALLRVQHPAGRLMAPYEFMSVAEDTGLIAPMGQWVLVEALAQHARWSPRLGVDTPSVTVNLSARQIGMPTFVADMLGALHTSGVSPTALALELTESILLEASRTTIDSLAALRSAGVGLGIDDFGTGYSSLTYLRRFPVDFVKVDRTFVAGLGRDPEDEAIVRAVVSLGKALGLQTVGEGVESAEQLSILERLGCDRAQGFYIARPMPGAELEDVVGWGLLPEA